MALPSANKTFHADASVTTDVWMTTAKATHPTNGQTPLVWDDVGNATLNAFYTGAGGGTHTWVSNGINGLGSMDLTTSGSFRMYTEPGFSAQPAVSNFITNAAGTLFMVLQVQNAPSTNSANTWQNTKVIGDNSEFMGLFAKSSGGVHTMMAYNWDGSDDKASMTFALNTPLVVMWKHGGGNLTLDINDSGSPATVASGNTSNVSAHVNMVGISSGTIDALCGEVVFYNAALSGTDLSDAWAYFIAKWVTAASTGQPTMTRWGQMPHVGLGVGTRMR